MRGAEKLFDAITEVREDLVEEALDHRFQAKKAIPWQRYAKWAACLALVVCIGYLAANLDLRMGSMNSAAGNSGSNSAAGETTGDTADDAGDGSTSGSDGAAPENGGSGGESEPTPSSEVPALSLAEEDSGVTAVRTLTLEFAPDGTASATDRYTLTNGGETAVTVTLCYEGTDVFFCTLNGDEISSGTQLTLESGGTAEVVLYSAVMPEDNTLTLAVPGNLEVPEATLHLIDQPDGLSIHELGNFEQMDPS